MNRYAMSLLAGVAAASLVTAATAADLIIEPPPVGVVDVSNNWDGLFVGVFAGYGWGTLTDETDGGVGLELPDGDIDLAGWVAGVNAGANFTLSNGIVAGIVGDIAWSDIGGGAFSDPPDFEFDTTINWIGSLRGRVGFDGGAFLPYVTGGLALANLTVEDLQGGILDESQTHVGWTLGAGVEFAAAENISVDVLYRYSDYGTQSYDDFGADIGLTTHTIQAGVNFRF